MSIRSAETLSSSFYTSDKQWAKTIEGITANSWQFLGHESQHFADNKQANVSRLDSSLLLTKSNNRISLLPNVCTHRASQLLANTSNADKIVCPYHGRRFNLEGKLEFMPGFSKTENFPRACDHLKQLPLENWDGLLWGNLNGESPMNRDIEFIKERIGHLPLQDLKYLPQYSKRYTLNAHWALYVDNYLEGFHIPFVHPDLNQVLNYGDYQTLCQGDVVLQIGYTDKESVSFSLPAGHVDAGKHVAAYYYWVWPNTMLNFYPWGLSMNVLLPIDKNYTVIDFYTYVLDEKLYIELNGFDGIDKTEQEDEYIVEQVQKGMESGFYTTGRYSPDHEQGVYHFHQLIKQRLLV